MAAEAEENAEDKRGQGALAKVSAERKLRGPNRREDGSIAFDKRWRKKKRGWMETGKAVSRLSDVEIDGKTRNRETRTGPKDEEENKKNKKKKKTKKKRKGMRSLSAFLPVAKLRIDVSRHDSMAWKLRLSLKHIQTHIHALDLRGRMLFSDRDCCSVRSVGF